MTGGYGTVGRQSAGRVRVVEVDEDTRTTSPRRLHDLLPVLIRMPTVELRLTVPDTGRRPALDALRLDPLRARIGQVFFFDTPDLVLGSHGVVLKARRLRGRTGESTVTRRHLAPSEVPAGVRRAAGFAAEVDVRPEGFVCSPSFRGAVDNALVRKVHHASAPVRKLFTKPQRAFYAAGCPGGPALDDLVVLGPVNVLELTLRLPELDRTLLARHWSFPDGSRTLEISTRCAPDEAFDVSVATKGCLAGRGLELTGDQETRTRRALVYFVATGAAR